MLKKKEMVYYFRFCKNCFGLCVSLSLLSYPANAKVLMNFSTLLPFEAYIWNWVRRSDDSLCHLSDTLTWLWWGGHGVILIQRNILRGATLPPGGTLKISKCLSYCSSAHMKKCLYYFLPALISSLSQEAHFPLFLFATYLLLSPFTWVSTSTRMQKKPCPLARSMYSPAGPLQSPAHQGLFWWHLIEQLLVSI